MDLRLLLLVAPLLGCGPPRVDADDGGHSSSESSSDSESSEGDSEDGSDSTSTGLDFLPSFDLGGPDPCDPFMQDCPEGEKCVAYASSGGPWDANKCVPVLGDQHPGEPCHYSDAFESTDDCDATSFCWDVTIDGTGTCAPLCLGSADVPQCPDPIGCRSYGCLLAGNFTPNVCILSCDPLAQDCGEGLACFWDGHSFQCIFTTEDHPIGEACGFINDCVAGSNCTEAELLPSCAGDFCCTPSCDPTAIVDPCPELLAGTSCVVFEEASEDLPNCPIGRCLAPPP